MKGLSKSRYTLYSQCPKALWLKVFKPEEAAVDTSTEARFEAGNMVGDLAMGLFGSFTEVTVQRPDGGLDLTAMIKQTQAEMQQGTDTICEASFTYDGNYCAVDILRKTPDGWAIYEVKSSSFPEFDGQETKLEKYAPDIAYQKWVSILSRICKFEALRQSIETFCHWSLVAAKSLSVSFISLLIILSTFVNL